MKRKNRLNGVFAGSLRIVALIIDNILAMINSPQVRAFRIRLMQEIVASLR